MLSKVVEEGSIVAPAFFALLLIGQTLLKLAANEGCILGSMSCVALKLRILFTKDEQCENPIVWPPAKASGATFLSLFLVNIVESEV